MKMLKNKKALSPVIASIILIAVTVAVSIAVAAWMGALSFTFMSSGENLGVGNPWGWTYNQVYVNVTNSGSSALSLTAIRVNGNVASTWSVNYNSGTSGSSTLQAGKSAGLLITNPNGNWTAQIPYTLTLVTGNNHEFQTVGTYSPFP